MRTIRHIAFFVGICLSLTCQGQTATVMFTVAPVIKDQSFHLTMEVSGVKQDTLFLKMPAWTPGYYQLLNFADQVSNLTAKNSSGNTLVVKKSGRNGWKVATQSSGWIQLSYDVSAKRAFVATPFVLENRAYISPPGVFLHLNGDLNRPAVVTLQVPDGWRVATGLEPVGTTSKFAASDFDVLYDSPILMGELEELPAFDVQGRKHRFIGFKLEGFDKAAFMNDLKKIVETSVTMMRDIPYKEYTFIGIGPGQGGIEHLNSTSFGFSGESLKTREGQVRMYAFLAHEYFHHYNVKRIRPVELGPFDYDRENRTNMLWVAEGFTVYYDLLIAYRAGLMTQQELFAGISSRIAAYENKPGKNFQSATQASYNTWSDGPFGRTDDEVNRTVSVYDKGAALGLLLDFAIRNASGNRKSLDDVMRQLYQEYYLGKRRGFTEAEFRFVCEQIAGTPLTEIFDYASTTKTIDYKKYFSYAGLAVESEAKPVAGGWLGISARKKGDSLVVWNVDYESPAWKSGIRRNMSFVVADGSSVEPVIKTMKAGDSFLIRTKAKGALSMTLGTKSEASFAITPLSTASAAQKKCLGTWLHPID